MSAPSFPSDPSVLQRLGRRHPLVPITVGVLLYSTVTVFVRASSTSGPVFSFWRLWFGVLVLGGASLVSARRRGVWPSRAAWRYAVGAGVAFGAHQLLLFTAVKLTSVADVTLVNTVGPIVTAVLAVPMFGERPGRGFQAWSLVAMLGAGVVVAGSAAGPQGSPLGMTLALVNVVAFAVFFLISKSSRDHLDVLPFLAGTLTVGAVIVTGYLLLVGDPVTAATRTDLLYAAIVAVGPGALGHIVMTWPLAWVPANIPPVLRLGLPVAASLWAWLFLGEGVAPQHLLGGALTIVGVAGAVTSRSGRRLVAEASEQEEDRRRDAVAA